MMGLAIMAVSSCSKDVVKETSKGTPIDFRVAVGDPTRGVDFTTYNLNTFYCTAVSGTPDGDLSKVDGFFYKDIPFTRIGDYFYSYPTYYWPEDNRFFCFVGYAPSAEELGVTVETRIDVNDDSNVLKWYFKGLAPAQNIKDQVDFVTGFTMANKEIATQDGLNISMHHALTQIELRAYSTNSTYTYNVAGIRIANVQSKADLSLNSFPNEFDFDYDGTLTTYEDTYDTPITLANWTQKIMNPESGNAIILPQRLVAWDPEGDPTNTAKGAYFSIKLQILDKNGIQIFPEEEGEYGWAAMPVSGDWYYGDKYTYTLDFTNGAGYIDPTDPNNPGKNVLGNKLAFTTRLDAWDDKSSVQASNSDLIGHWVGLKGNYIDSDDNIEHKFETAEAVEDWLGEFYDFIVPDDHTIKIKNAAGEYNTPTTFNVEDNYVLMDCFREGDGYALKPYIQHIDETSAIIVNTYVYSSYTRVQTIYYQKNPLD